MPADIDFGTGLASLLTGFSMGATHTLQQKYAQEQRDKEREKFIQEAHQTKQEDIQAQRDYQDQMQQQEIQARQKQAQDIVGFIAPYISSDSPNPKAAEEIEKEDLLRGWGGVGTQHYGSIVDARKSQPYSYDANGNIVKDENGNPKISNWYERNYSQERTIRHENDPKNNETTEIKARFDPNINLPQMDGGGNPIEIRGKSWKTLVENKGSTGDKISAPRIFSKEAVKNNYKEAMAFETAINKERETIDYLSQHPVSHSETKRNAALKAVSINAKVAQDKYDNYVNMQVPTISKAGQEYIGDGNHPDKGVYLNGIIKGFRDGTFNTHDVNVMLMKYHSMYKERAPSTAYNAETKEEEIQQEQPTKSTVKSKPEIVKEPNPSEPTKPIKGKKKVPNKGDVVSGYKFKGGDPAKQENWEIAK